MGYAGAADRKERFQAMQIRLDFPEEAKGYTIVLEAGALVRLGEFVEPHTRGGKCALVVDAAIAEGYGRVAESSLRQSGLSPVVAELPSGETSKTLAQIEELYHLWLKHGLERGAPAVALGGGVTGDATGFAAATYLRGVPFVQCPTTLLAMVDASVGGKVGVNVPEGKNLVGAFYQPRVIVMDPELLRSLPARELAAGLAECIKHGAIRDASLCDWMLEVMPRLRSLDSEALIELVRRNVEIKADVVRADEREAGVRAHLNFGHTFAHAIEATSGYGTVLHGEAVGLGMLAAAELAVQLGVGDRGVRERLEALVAAAGLPTRAELAHDAALQAAMALDKKVADSRIRFVVVPQLGEAEIRDDASASAITAAWDSIRL